MKKTISIIGSPGSGKGTQIDLLKQKLDVISIRTGELVRRLAVVDEQTREILSQGKLADNNKVNDIIGSEIDKVKSNQTIVLDAFPRDIIQAHWLDQFLAEMGRRLDMVIFLQIPDKEAIKRMKKRNRKYETTQNIEHRLQDYHSITKKVIKYYQNRGILRTINGVGEIKDINQDILKTIQSE